jgi:hypothetical protein
MSFDKFLLAVEPRDLSQADKSITNLFLNDVLVDFIIQKFARLKSKRFFSVFQVRGKSERIECIHFAESSGLSC